MGMDSRYRCKCAMTELCELGLLLVFEQQNISELSTSHLRSLLFEKRAYTCVYRFTTHVEVFCLLLVVFSELTLTLRRTSKVTPPPGYKGGGVDGPPLGFRYVTIF